LNLKSSVWVVKTQFGEIQKISGKNKSKTFLQSKSAIKRLKSIFKPAFELLLPKIWLFGKETEGCGGDGEDGLLS
jgi:hypothetical protein